MMSMSLHQLDPSRRLNFPVAFAIPMQSLPTAIAYPILLQPLPLPLPLPLAPVVAPVAPVARAEVLATPGSVEIEIESID